MSHELRQHDIFVKGFKQLKIDFWYIVIGVTAYLSGYTGRICLRSNVYFQDIKKLLQIKKVTYI